MNRKFWTTFLAVYVAMNVLNVVIHVGLLGGAYRAEDVMKVFRPEQEQIMWIHFVTALVFSFFFVLIFAKGYEGKGLAEGVRFGSYVGLMVAIPMAYDSFAVYPIPYSLAISWFVYGMVQYILLGVVAALVYGKKP